MTKKTIGYARTATTQKSIAPQIAELKAAGCEEVYSDEATSGSGTNRQGLNQARAALRRGDTFMVASTDRITRDIGGCHDFVRGLMRDGIELKTLVSPYEAAVHLHQINYGSIPRSGASLLSRLAYRIGSFLVKASGY